jgi:hypothetical protein
VKFGIGKRVELDDGVEGKVTFRDPGSGRYVVQDDKGKEHYPTERGIRREIKETPAKRSIFHRK